MANKVSLTIERVKAAQPQGARYVIWSKDVKGFGLRITPDGAKSYILKYLKDGRQRWLTIGSANDYTPKQAEDAATSARGDLKKDRDPATEKKAKRHRGATVRDLCMAYVKALEAGEVLIGKSRRPKSPDTITSDKSRINAQILPLIGNRHLGELTSHDIETFMHAVAKGKAAHDRKTEKGRSIVRGGKGAATRTVGLLGGVITWGMKQKPPYCAMNPVRGVVRFEDRKMERFLSTKETKAIGRALEKMEAAGDDPYPIAAIRLLMLTGCRLGEVLKCKWSYVDFDKSRLRLPTSKSGEKIVPLGAAALMLLKRLPRVEGNPYCIPGRKEGRHFVGLPKVFRRVLAKAEIPHTRQHDLRHTFASVGAGAGMSLLMIGAILGHADPRTTQRYAHLADTPLQDATNRVARTIDAGLKGKKSATVHRLSARR